MRLLKICCSEWINETRDMRELSACRELGMDIIVLAKGKATDKGNEEMVESFVVKRYSTRPWGEKIPNFISRIISLFTWGRFASKQNADIISGHDIGGLTIAWIANLFLPRKKRAKLVYDSHEFELGRNRKRLFTVTMMIAVWEKYLIQKCAFSIVVNDSIADEIKKVYRLQQRPIVVRNVPYRWNIDEQICQEYRKRILTLYEEKIDKIVMYHGVVGDNRGIKEIILATSHLKNVGVFILGRILDVNYYNSLKKIIKEHGLEGKIYFHEAVNSNEMWKYVGAADLGVCYIIPVYKSYYYALPNKLFENIQALTPVVVSNLPEMKKIVLDYQVGIVCKNNTVESLEESIRDFFDKTQFENKFVENEKSAKKSLCWEREKIVLKNAYKELL